MINDALPPDTSDIHRLVDGHLDPAARRRVEARLAGNPEDQRRADDYQAIRLGLRQLYDPVLHEPVPARLRRGARRWQRPLAGMAAGLALLLTGTWIGMHLESGSFPALAGPPHVVREAAMAYAVYTPEVRHPVEVSADQEQHLVSWLTKRMGSPVRAPRLAALGFELMGGRLLASDDGPGALFMYQNESGQRIVLYVCRNDQDGRATAFRFARHERVSVFYWLDGPFSYALAGEIDRAGLLGLAEVVYREVTI